MSSICKKTIDFVLLTQCALGIGLCMLIEFFLLNYMLVKMIYFYGQGPYKTDLWAIFDWIAALIYLVFIIILPHRKLLLLITAPFIKQHPTILSRASFLTMLFLSGMLVLAFIYKWNYS